MQFYLNDQQIEVGNRYMVNAGYAGCNQDVVKAHIRRACGNWRQCAETGSDLFIPSLCSS